MALQVIDSFTTRDGLWEVDARPYGLTKEDLEDYGGLDIPGKGGASHIFVKAKPGDTVDFYTADSTSPQYERKQADSSGWVNFPMWKTSAYWPPNGGPWNVAVNEYHVASGLGLPEGLHVSTFLIVEDVDEGSQHPPTQSGESVELVLRTMVDGIQVKEQILWQSK
jgi:hypothetical protein